MRRECGSEAGGCGNAAGSAAMRRGAAMRWEVRQ